MKQIAGKLRSRKGETIAETLVSLLVGCLALMVLAGMIAATARLVRTSEDKMDEYYVESAKLAEPEKSGESDSVTVTVSGSEVETSVSCEVAAYENTIFSGHTVTAYRLTTSDDSGSGG